MEGIHGPVGVLKGSPSHFPACVCSALSLTAERQPEFSEGLAGEAQEEGEMLQIQGIFQRLGPGGGRGYKYQWELLALETDEVWSELGASAWKE